MPRARVPEPTTLSLNLAPMVDVVMCLIIFFMLATKLVERENAPIDLPVASTAKEAERRELGRRVVINVRRAADAATAEYLIGDRRVSMGEIERRLDSERRRDPKVRCVIRGERELPCAHVESLLLACAKAGVSNVVFAAVRDGEGRGR